MQRRTSAAQAPRRAFTLVELLVVIIIVAILAALAVQAVMRATVTAQNARIKTEIDMLHQAVMQYKNEYGSFPPAIDTVGGTNGPINKHIRRLFPRVDTTNLPNNDYLARIHPDTALTFWLNGFTDAPTDPLAIANVSLKRKRLFDFDQARVTSDRFVAPSKPKSPYIYIPSTLYTDPTGSIITTFSFSDLNFRIPAYTAYFAQRVPISAAAASFSVVEQPAFNADTFQILSAGRDEVFGTDDDMSNFWPGTRK
ncbi:MAG: type II secretion system protein, partial [Planctomycetaceae bacterium]